MRIFALEFLSKNEKRSRKRREAKCPRKGHVHERDILVKSETSRKDIYLSSEGGQEYGLEFLEAEMTLKILMAIQ